MPTRSSTQAVVENLIATFGQEVVNVYKRAEPISRNYYKQQENELYNPPVEVVGVFVNKPDREKFSWIGKTNEDMALMVFSPIELAAKFPAGEEPWIELEDLIVSPDSRQYSIHEEYSAGRLFGGANVFIFGVIENPDPITIP